MIIEKRFQINLYNLNKSWPGAIAILIFFAAVCVMANALHTYRIRVSDAEFLIGIIVVCAGGGYAIFRLIKWLAVEPMLIEINAMGLSVNQMDTGEYLIISFADILSYSYQSYKDTDSLRFKMHDGKKLRLSVNSMYTGEQNFSEVVEAFEAALHKYQQQSGQPVTIIRKRNFFEKPISTIVLILLTVGLVWAIWIILASPQRVKGSTFMALGSYLVYVAAWFAARRRRDAK